MIGPKKKEDSKTPARRQTLIGYTAKKVLTSYGYGKSLKEYEKKKAGGKPNTGRR